MIMQRDRKRGKKSLFDHSQGGLLQYNRSIQQIARKKSAHALGGALQQQAHNSPHLGTRGQHFVDGSSSSASCETLILTCLSVQKNNATTMSSVAKDEHMPAN